MTTARTQSQLEQKSQPLSRFQKMISWGKDQATRLYNLVPWAPIWLPINSSNYTGWAFPQTMRLKGSMLTGRQSYLVEKDGKGVSEDILRAGKLSEKDPLGRCYLSAGFVAPTWVFLITQPGVWDQVLLHNSAKLERGAINLITDNEFGKDNIMGLPSNQEWKEARNALFKSLHKDGALENLCNKMQTILEDHIKNISKDNENLEELFGKLSIDVMSLTHLGVRYQKDLGFISELIKARFNSMIDPRATFEIVIKAAIEKYFSANIQAAVIKFLKLSRAEPDNKIILHKLIEQNLLKPHIEDIRGTDNFLRDFAIHQQQKTQPIDEEKIDYKSKAIISEIVFLFLMGQENIAPFLHFTLMLIAKFPETAEKIKQEIQDVNDEITFKNLKKMHHLFCVLLESLRLYAPAPIGARVLKAGLTLGNIGPTKTFGQYNKAMAARNKCKDVHLPRGTLLIFSPLITHHSQKIYGESANEFQPERWIELVKSKKISLQNIRVDGFYPFGHGERRCPAQPFTLVKAAVTMCEILNRFKVTLAPDMQYPPKIYAHGSLRSSTPIKLLFSPKEDRHPENSLSAEIKKNKQ